MEEQKVVQVSQSGSCQSRWCSSCVTMWVMTSLPHFRFRGRRWVHTSRQLLLASNNQRVTQSRTVSVGALRALLAFVCLSYPKVTRFLYLAQLHCQISVHCFYYLFFQSFSERIEVCCIECPRLCCRLTCIRLIIVLPYAFLQSTQNHQSRCR